MRRAVFAILGTAAVTSFLVAVKANVGPSQPTASPPRSQAGGPPSQPGQPGSSGAPGDGSGRFGGRPVDTPYGPVSVTITMTGGRITAIEDLVPLAGDSKQISGDAAPKLRQQALTKQSAQIDTVSGATYTSEAYKQSLQSALDQAKRG